MESNPRSSFCEQEFVTSWDDLFNSIKSILVLSTVDNRAGDGGIMSNNILGHWKIVWAAEQKTEGLLHINHEGDGEFEIEACAGRFFAEPKKQYFCSKWEGSCELDDAFGEIEGWIEGEELHGNIEFWNDDEWEFRAVRVK